MTIYERIKLRRVELNMTQEELAKKVGYKSRSAINKIEKGLRDINQTQIIKFAEALNTSTSFLMDGLPHSDTNHQSYLNLEEYNIKPVKIKKFPIIGEIACGKPIYCNEEYETFIEASSEINADFCLIAKGDSMINARIFDGDVVFIKFSPKVENGEIAAVIINDEATLKRVYLKPDRIILRPDNPLYEDIIIEKEDMNNIKILGKAVAFMSYI